MKNKILIISILFFIVSHTLSAQYIYPKRELRGAWIATVKNIDWPKSPFETSGQQISELVAIFDSLKAAGINTVYFQIRTECDALYKSSYEPWSYWLTGKQGKAPKPFYDPLAFAVSEAHLRGMEIQAWFNPYRAVREIGDYQVSDSHISKTHPKWILNFKNYKMLNPGIPAVRHYIAKIVADVVKRYDVDGIHFDDYFYPYTPHITNQDAATFGKFKGKFKNIDDWRRNNINQMIADVYDTIKSINPKIQFGVSPFGIVENKYAGTKGYESYNKIYCDPLNWISNKTVDYVAPQLYWAIGNHNADFAKLLPWWSSVVDGRELFIGIFSSKMAAPDYKGSPSEIEKEIKLSRQMLNVGGTIFFSAKSITENYSHFADSLKLYYKYPSIIPAMPWIDSVPPLPPVNLSATGDSAGVILKWNKPVTASDGDSAYRFVIYKFNQPDEINLDDAKHILKITNGSKNYFMDSSPNALRNSHVYLVTSLDRMNNESKASIANFTPAKK
jgi:uncharacterized lipoprotein YddW (UPF0748 family)